MEQTKICRQCGREKPVEDFSLSYKSLCKECVAKNARNKRNGMILSSSDADHSVQFIPSPRMTIATAAMQGLLADGWGSNSNEFVAQKAVDLADALLNKLSEPKDGV